MTLASDRYSTAFSPVTIGKLRLRNRIFVPAHTTNFADRNLPSDRHLAYHRARAAGGVGLIIYETIRVHPTSIGRVGATAGYHDDCILPFRKITDAVHAEGAAIFGQIVHMGREVDGTFARAATWGPSETPWSLTAVVPHAMTHAEIQLVTQNHADTARRLLRAGFDGIEVHLGHGHLLQQFLSPSSNRRTDQYGGSDEHRSRFAVEVLAAVRAEIGPDVPMGIRVSAEEYLPDGLSLADMVRLVPLIVGQVEVDFVNVSHSAYHASYSLSTQMADMQFSSDQFRILPKGISQSLAGKPRSPPVFAVCKFTEIAEADSFLAEGDVAMVGMARAHIADPEIVKKTREGREHDIRRCIHCNQGCTGMLQLGQPITCLVNPMAGREAIWPTHQQKTATAQRVLVVGGGPAGLEAAATAALSGHEVHLWEMAPQLGGELVRLDAMPQRRDFLKLLEDQTRRCRALGVSILLDQSATPTNIEALGPDVLVLATGATHAPVTFADGSSGASMQDVLARADRFGTKIAVLDTLGSWAVASVVEFLCNLGREVTLFVPSGQIAWNVPIYSGFAWRKRVQGSGLKVVALKDIHGFRDGRVILRDAWSGELSDGGAFDAVVAPSAGSARTDLYTAVANAGFMAMERVVTVGDAVSPRTALEAVFEGHRAGRELAEGSCNA